VGFEEFKQGLLVRPNNLEGGVARARERLYNLGLEQEAMVFRLGDLEQTEQKAAMELWDTNALEQQYTEGLREMESWMVRADELTPDVAARETFLIGDRILHHIVFDPLLPTEMINTQARARYIDTMARFDEVGKVHWRKIYRSLG
jgi:phenylacetic acid degradation operon negative regulatory protein